MNIRETDLKNINNNGIYLITNLANNKHYVGQAISNKGFVGRWNEYKRYNKHLTNAFIKYGKDNFEYSIIEVIEQNDLDLETFKNIVSFWETYWILYYDTLNPNKGYNKCKYSHSTKGADFYKTKEHKNKLSLTIKKRYLENPQYKIRVGKERSNYFKNNPDKCYFNIKDNKGKNNSFFGKKHSDETKKKMSNNHYDCSGKNNPSAKAIIQLTLDCQLVREYDYIRQTKEYNFNSYYVGRCVNHKYITKLGNNIYGKKNEEKYIWLSKEEYKNKY